MDVYRFRSMKYLLGEKYQELERQSIYFANSDELNDPMEGFRDIVWDGDKIVWTNFFKHYVYCLYESYTLLDKTADSKELGTDDIPILGRWDQIPDPQSQRLFNDIWQRFFKLPNIPEIIEAVADRNRDIRYRELGYYFRVIQSVVLVEIEASHIAHGFMYESERTQLPEGSLGIHKMCRWILASIKQFDQAKTEEDLNAMLLETVVRDDNERIKHQLENPISSKNLRNNSHLMHIDFPNTYLREIERLLWFNWRPACFTKSCHNSSVWGSYGDKHKGACLIFESVKIDGSHQLGLSEGAGKGIPASKFREVVYGDKLNKVDFFRSIGRSTVEQLRELWYTDAEGNFSECGDHIPRDGEIDNDDTIAWRKKYWDSFYRDITTKTKDWKYEQEWRLILEDRSSGFVGEKRHTLTYDFNSLKGIIFGIRTPDEDRLEIINIIRRKCEEYKRTDFKFYQADYSEETGDIRKYEMLLPWSL